MPKSVRRTHPEWFEHPTVLGYPKGARKQYRYGRMHLREYDDRITMHEDRFDPRTKPLEHVMHEAPEVLIGAASGALAGFQTYKIIARTTGSPAAGLAAGILAGGAAFALGHHMASKLRGE